MQPWYSRGHLPTPPKVLLRQAALFFRLSVSMVAGRLAVFLLSVEVVRFVFFLFLDLVHHEYSSFLIEAGFVGPLCYKALIERRMLRGWSLRGEIL